MLLRVGQHTFHVTIAVPVVGCVAAIISSLPYGKWDPPSKDHNGSSINACLRSLGRYYTLTCCHRRASLLQTYLMSQRIVNDNFEQIGACVEW